MFETKSLHIGKMVRSRFKEVPLIQNEALPHFILRKAQTYGDRIAMISGSDGKKWTYQEFVTCTRSVAAALFHQGMHKGDTVCMFLPNIMEYPIILHGILSTGATIATANPAFMVDDLVYEIKDCQSRYLITVPDLLPTVKAAMEKTNILKIVYVVGQATGFTSYQDLLQEGRALPYPTVEFDAKDDVAAIIYTSGTTGQPKGTMLTHFGLTANICLFSIPELGLYNRYNKVIAFLPFYHVFGIGMFMGLSFAVGDTMIVMNGFEFQKFLNIIQTHQITFLIIVPPVALLLAKSPAVLQYDLSSVRNIVCGGAPLSAEVTQLLRARFPRTQHIRQAFGMTEMGSHMGIQTEPYGNCGRLICNTEARIVDTENGKDLGPGEPGEMLLRGPQMMKGYLNKPAITAETIDKDGWLHTGDMAKYDSDGNFFIVDRIKEMIKYKAIQVAPADLEAILLTHPEVAEAAVIGLQDLYAGELPLAFVVRKPGASIKEADLRKFVDGKVATYKQLRGGVKFIESIPKTASGKILRRNLRDFANKLQKSKL